MTLPGVGSMVILPTAQRISSMMLGGCDAVMVKFLASEEQQSMRKCCCKVDIRNPQGAVGTQVAS